MFRRIDPIPHALLDSELASVIPTRELRTLERRGTTVHLAEGREAIRQRQIGRECMIVADGTFAVTRDGATVAELRAGDVMGELALFTGRPRNATVTATTDSVVYAFNRGEFISLLGECPTLAGLLRAAADDRALVG